MNDSGKSRLRRGLSGHVVGNKMARW